MITISKPTKVVNAHLLLSGPINNRKSPREEKSLAATSPTDQGALLVNTLVNNAFAPIYIVHTIMLIYFISCLVLA